MLPVTRTTNMYFLESIHGVVVDVCNNLQLAKKLQQESGGFRTIPRRIFTIVSGKKVYHG